MASWIGWWRKPPPPPPAPVPRPPALAQPGEVFTPTQPKAGRRLVGRMRELARIMQLLRQDRAHVVLYSERGRGKTSLSNLAIETLRRDGVIVARHTCEAGSTFDSIMRGLARDLPPALLAVGPRHRESEGCEAALPAGELRPRDVVGLPDRLACHGLVCVVDEFDRVADPDTRTRLADTIKQLSDRDSPLLFLIVGVSADLEQILGQHPSIQRSVTGVHLPLFTHAEIAQILAGGGKETGFNFPSAAVARIAVLCRGMPYMAQLLGLRLTQAAAARGDRTVSEADFSEAVSRMVEDAPLRVLSLYAQLTDYGRQAEMVGALRIVANAPQDAWGRLSVDVPDGVALVAGRPIARSCWERIAESGVLAAGPPGSGQFSFAERGLMHHVLLLAASAPPTHETEPRPQPATEPLLRAVAGGQPWTPRS